LPFDLLFGLERASQNAKVKGQKSKLGSLPRSLTLRTRAEAAQIIEGIDTG
jgi:hypothetical protein